MKVSDFNNTTFYFYMRLLNPQEEKRIFTGTFHLQDFIQYNNNKVGFSHLLMRNPYTLTSQHDLYDFRSLWSFMVEDNTNHLSFIQNLLLEDIILYTPGFDEDTGINVDGSCGVAASKQLLESAIIPKVDDCIEEHEQWIRNRKRTYD